MQPRALLWLVVTSTAGLWYLPFTSTMLILLSCLVLRLILKWWFSKHIGGYTGDCLGFAQQVQELLILASPRLGYLRFDTHLTLAQEPEE